MLGSGGFEGSHERTENVAASLLKLLAYILERLRHGPDQDNENCVAEDLRTTKACFWLNWIHHITTSMYACVPWKTRLLQGLVSRRSAVPLDDFKAG